MIPSAFRTPRSAFRTSPPSPVSPLRTPHSALRTSPFTLVEILVVLVVIAILMLIGMPAFEKIAKGQGAELAAREMVGKLKAVRAYSVSNRKHVALIMPMKDYPASGAPAEMMNRSYRAAIVQKNGNKWDYQYWVPNEKWNHLPTGTAFLEIDDDDGVNESSGKLSPQNNTFTMVDKVDFSDAGGNSAVNDVAAIIYRGSGQSVNIDSGDVIPVVRFVEIGEGVYSGGNLLITNTDPSAYISVKIDQFSGRVSYGKE
jgi:prepilin-type N-terminal cleavage/methylation domain-containing protein